ncbi:hypothetical protein F5B22DRAFT_651061 [Xylaria bambusicola]|uniref:uncharacterized protein n=1 Tax=Xylaria bambusicola TaxID=326684 RepID=UPI0020073C9C|nr:uncharacterized protein F5B22DRAFT_651061 [Xylaria bambusicola]KAI0506126.1 hypothetical protein F5B22DRAFT_651061 [Xylaria bambusicola]
MTKNGAGTTRNQSLVDQPIVGWPLPSRSSHVLDSPPTGILNSSQIDPRNLGSAKEALHSHPTRIWVEDKAHGFTENDKGTKVQNRKFVICERGHDGHMVIKRPGQPAVAVSKAQGAVLDQILGLGGQEAIEDINISKAGTSAMPSIQVTPPSEGSGQIMETDHLCVNNAYRELHEKSKKEIRLVKWQLKRVVPLAYLISEAEGIDINNTTALKEKLEWIIEDSRMLEKLLPLITTLCEDQRIEFNEDALKILPRALQKVLYDARETNRARFVAGHHKRARHALEGRVRRLESELSRLRYTGEEDYIRL